MTVFSIDSTLFETLSDTANVDAEQLKSLVAQANSNVLLNSLLSIADARGDLIIRVANSEELRNPSYVEAGAWFDPYKKADDGKFELVLRPDKFIGPNAKFSRFTGVAELVHELDYYTRAADFLYARSLLSAEVRPDLSSNAKFTEIVRIRMEAEVLGWHAELLSLRTSYNAGDLTKPLPEQVMLPVQKLLYAEQSRLIAQGLRGVELEQQMAVNGAANAQDNRIVGNSADNILDGVTGADSCLIEAMASFDPPAPGYTERPASYQAALAPMLAANWQSSLG